VMLSVIPSSWVTPCRASRPKDRGIPHYHAHVRLVTTSPSLHASRVSSRSTVLPQKGATPARERMDSTSTGSERAEFSLQTEGCGFHPWLSRETG
jgi:hypothetical protein